MERMRWFTGRFVTARDLTDEQQYMLQRRWLTNRLLHGEGVLCGLDVVPHERADCAVDHGLDRARDRPGLPRARADQRLPPVRDLAGPGRAGLRTTRA